VVSFDSWPDIVNLRQQQHNLLGLLLLLLIMTMKILRLLQVLLFQEA
jgi:hypothetical protein